MEKWFYDVEVSPNFFCVSFMNERGVIETFVLFEDTNDMEQMESFLLSGEKVFYGYNNIHYDAIILRYILDNLYEKNLTEKLFNFSSRIISADRKYPDDEVNYYKYQEVINNQVDLMKVMAFDKLGVSLKQCAIALRWHTIQDLPFEYDHRVRNTQEARIFIEYNINDVEISKKLYDTIFPQLEMREKLSQSYGVDLRSASDSKMANVILEKYFVDDLGKDISEVRSKRTPRDFFMLSECIAPNISFQTNYLKRIKNEISRIAVRKLTNFKYKKTIEFAGVTYELGVGGLHSNDFPALFVSDDNFEIVDNDVASYYPSMMIENKIIPAHLGGDFISVLERITKERLAAKKTDKIKADALKITINSVFGKLGSDTFWLQDEKAMLSVTVSGQLYLMMLIEAFVLNGIEVISANTDGVVVRCPKHLENKRQEVCRWWEGITRFTLEDTHYDIYARNDVNNYVTKKTNGEVKAKGRYVLTPDVKKAFRHPIVPRAMYEYLVNGVSVEDTIHSCQDIMDFCVSQKAGGKFQMQFIHETGEVEYLQKNNRFYISNSGGQIKKKNKETDSEIGLFVGEKLRILNKYNPSLPFVRYDVNYQFYINEAKKYVGEILPYDREFVPFADEQEGDYVEIDNSLSDEILLKTHGMKNLSDKVFGGLLNLIPVKFETFLDLLVYADEHGYLASKYEELIKIGIFSQYGNRKRLLKMLEEFKSGKNRYSSKHSEKTKEKRLSALLEFWDSIPDEKSTVREILSYEMSILGRYQSTFNVGKMALVSSLEERVFSGEKSSPIVTLYMLSTGKTGKVKVNKKEFGKNRFSEDDFIRCHSFQKKPKWKKTDDGFIQIPNTEEWWLTDYEVVDDSRLEN